MAQNRRLNRQQALACLSYRIPMGITELYIQRNGDGYYVCPRCRITLERDFCAFCDRCGQRLNWTQYRSARRTYGNNKNF